MRFESVPICAQEVSTDDVLNVVEYNRTGRIAFPPTIDERKTFDGENDRELMLCHQILSRPSEKRTITRSIDCITTTTVCAAASTVNMERESFRLSGPTLFIDGRVGYVTIHLYLRHPFDGSHCQ